MVSNIWRSERVEFNAQPDTVLIFYRRYYSMWRLMCRHYVARDHFVKWYGLRSRHQKHQGKKGGVSQSPSGSGWWGSSVVRMSVFSWRNFPDLWFTGHHFVNKCLLWGQPTRPTQPSIFSGSVWVVVHRLWGWRPLNDRYGLHVAVWLQSQSHLWLGLSLQPTGCTPALSAAVCGAV